ncbi:transglycosylase SLT domain-containing protein [Vibrio scophthalmi]|uniref:Endo-type membrane-bound lytic murein transglycosylase A-like protein n=1 Tax=Vibrio scophthalmi TaxID=45658 RepID=A0A1B1NNH6_9VIBR|nr:transglycosylase SLT domain-containing protein [Vibrio scophthalmi]ANS85280.1 Endo-type membrane-bound lytic murein transglycosylase A-like protein [Vibrio scophthalmi]ANU36217.1 Endo-type membrane-bound lytic murein transglycosylase A-like protein [Vibrio scophthalmi]
MLKSFLFCSLVVGLYAQTVIAGVEDLQAKFANQKQSLSDSFNQQKSQQVDRFEQAKLAYRDSFLNAQKRFSQQWDTPVLSSATTWVSYSEEDKVRRSLDFESGAYTIEVLGDKTQAQIDAIVVQQTERLLAATSSSAIKSDPVLNQIVSNNTPSNKLFSELDSTVITATKQQSAYRQAQGSKVTMVTMRFPQDKLSQRALQYIPQIKKQAHKWQVDPTLIIAIMHTESHFNPVAQSHIPAYGLMQIVPYSAGRDVTRVHQGQERVLSADELFVPDYNIEIGSAYLNILEQRYLNDIDDPSTRTFVAISAYNGGVGAVAKHFSGTGSLSKLAQSVNRMSSQQVYHSLVEDFPYKETRDYLKKVESKRQYYAPYF